MKTVVYTTEYQQFRKNANSLVLNLLRLPSGGKCPYLEIARCWQYEC